MRGFRPMVMAALLGGCGTPPPASQADHAAQTDSLRAWAAGIEAAFDRFEGCDGGAAARAFYAADGVVMTTDSATMTFTGDAWTEIFRSFACSRKESVFKLDSVIVRSLGPGIGVVAATYVETATDTTGSTQRLRGSTQWVVQHGPAGWKSTAVAATEHRSPVP